MHADMSKNLGIMGRFIMGLCDQKTLLVHFELESDLLMALSRDSLMIKDSAFKVYQWKNVMDGDYDAVISPAWIALPRLLECYWFPVFLSATGNSIGRFIRVDLPTASLAHPSAARICVEVDLSVELPMEIGIKFKGIKWQKIVYQNMATYCSNCRMQGYSTRDCRRGKAPHAPNISDPPNAQNQTTSMPIDPLSDSNQNTTTTN